MFRSFSATATAFKFLRYGTPFRRCARSPNFRHNAPFTFRTRSWALLFIPLLLLLSSVRAQAAEYIFPGHLPAGCVGDGISAGALVFNCAALTLAAGDSISIAGPTQINIAGNFTAGASSQLNVNGDSVSLNIYVTGVTFLGDYTVLNGNVFDTNATTGTITTGANSVVIGNLTATAGVINIGISGTVVGNLSTGAGAINVGDNGTVLGNVTTSAAGAITIGVNAKISGLISSKNGSGTGAGAITIGSGSDIKGGISTDAGAITLQVGSTVGGNITTGDGAITVATNTYVSGSVCTGNSGAITIGASAKIGGNVETATAGAITIGAKAIVSGDVKVESAGATTIAPDAKVGTSRIGTACGLGATTPKLAPRITSRDWRQLFMR